HRQTVLAGKSHTALLGLFALDSRLAQARSELARVHARVSALQSEQQQVRQQLSVVAANLRISQRLLGEHLRTLYEEGEPDAIAILLGSSSLDDAVTRLNELEQSARQGANAVTDTHAGRAKLTRLAATVCRARASSDLASRTCAATVAARG